MTEEVICHSCEEDYTLSDVEGGILFDGNPVCPECSEGIFDDPDFHAKDLIDDVCPESMRFCDWVNIFIRGNLS